MSRFATRILPALAWVALICYFSTRELDYVPPSFWSADKLMHAGAYSVLGFLSARAFSRGRAGSSVLAAATLSAFVLGGVLELYQATLPGRAAEVLDAAANGAGALAGSVVYGAASARVGFLQ